MLGPMTTLGRDLGFVMRISLPSGFMKTETVPVCPAKDENLREITGTPSITDASRTAPRVGHAERQLERWISIDCFFHTLVLSPEIGTFRPRVGQVSLRMSTVGRYAKPHAADQTVVRDSSWRAHGTAKSCA